MVYGPTIKVYLVFRPTFNSCLQIIHHFCAGLASSSCTPHVLLEAWYGALENLQNMMIIIADGKIAGIKRALVYVRLFMWILVNLGVFIRPLHESLCFFRDALHQIMVRPSGLGARESIPGEGIAQTTVPR